LEITNSITTPIIIIIICKKIKVGKNKIKNENIKEIIGVKGKPDIIDFIENKRL
jgi:hypothetical protein